MRDYSYIHNCYAKHTETITGTRIFCRLTCEENCQYRYLCNKYNSTDQADARMLNDVEEAIEKEDDKYLLPKM